MGEAQRHRCDQMFDVGQCRLVDGRNNQSGRSGGGDLAWIFASIFSIFSKFRARRDARADQRKSIRDAKSHGVF
jgi:hypothetical protein